MAFQTPLTIKKVIENIHKKKYLLPAIQREFVWGTDQIERLFDSLMQGYPVGSFLFWDVKKEKSKDFQFYEFIRNYHEKNNRHNPSASISGEEDIIAILDGQQRLTSMYIALKGTYAYKLPRMRRENPSAYPEQHLYVDLLGPSEDFDTIYDFRFLTPEKAASDNVDEVAFWFKVSDILNINDHFEVNQYLIEKGLSSIEREKALFANQTLFKLYQAINETPSINYYLEEEQKLDKVLNIFIRVNSGGTTLSYSDLLLSIATAQWKNKDARQEITKFVDEINQIGNGFKFDKDFVLKACLVLCDFKDIAFKVDNFNAETMQKIEYNWDNVKEAIRLAINLVSSFGYNQDTLTSSNAIIPIAYYLLKKGIPQNYVQSKNYQNDRNLVKKWLVLGLLKRVFSGQPDNVLRPLRKILDSNNNEFPLQTIIDEFKGGTKSFTFTDDEIDNLLSYQYGQKYTFSILSLLYPNLDFRNKFHLDHIFAKSLFTKRNLSKKGIPQDKVEFYIENVNSIVNLQLLEGIPNIEKSDIDFEKWLNETYKDINARNDYMIKHYIPMVSLDFTNFEEFIEKRREQLYQKFKLLV
ncbi:GmrSD restriction endonuclease domain-containing protein [Bacillus cereus group sp. MYBK30-1]|uniref:GmrSD restriction endonuclease domain-containing protein n=1 Tax=unclassified Bacillus cereus group TaxID=2750818 RepID=UPI003F792B54